MRRIFKVDEWNHILLGDVFEQRHHFQEWIVDLSDVLLKEGEGLLSAVFYWFSVGNIFVVLVDIVAVDAGEASLLASSSLFLLHLKQLIFLVGTLLLETVLLALDRISPSRTLRSVVIGLLEWCILIAHISISICSILR